MKILTISGFCCLVLGLPVQAALTLYYGNNNGGGGFLRDITGSTLTSGPKDNPGNGAVIQIGYYSLATTADPFAGNWVALAGPGTSVEAANIGEILGGGYVGSGLFEGTATFSTAAGGYPALSTPLAIRFYDGTSIDGSTYFNAVSMVDWKWSSPTAANTTVDMTIPGPGIPGLVWEGGEASAYRTTLPVPEPSVGLLAAAGISLLFKRRRR
jgi:hypothetical protein